MASPAPPSTPTLRDARALPALLAEELRRRGVPGVSLLLSGRSLDGLGARSFLAARPLAVAAADPGEPLRLRAGPAPWGRELDPCPLRAAAQLLARARPASPASGDFAGGAALTLSYDLGRRLERIAPDTPAEADPPPDLHLAVYGRVLCFDHLRGGHELRGAGPGLDEAEVEDALRAVALAESAAPSAPLEPEPGGESLDAASYRAAVEEARRLIRRGDLFEVNLSRRHRLPAADPARVASALRALAPAAYMADLDLGHDAAGAGRRLLSASPERFLRLEADGRVSSWPIKGTRPRGATPAEDARLAAELLESEKDAAELAMIVDLVRNDLGRVARPGSVRVAAPRLLQSWPAVHHTVAVVEAELAAGRDWADLVRAAFPPGSVTGAPKVRAQEVIEALEPVRRGLYCGAFGWVGFDGALDLAVAIRILDLTRDRTDVHAGGAVLLDSDPDAEEREARTKARALLRAAGAGRA
ncbi:MAG: anthranilate synthase component I family protein [Planctomycetota bacterium]